MKKINISKNFLIKEYLKNKKSTVQIAKIRKCNSTTIYKYLKKYNIKIRTKSESKKGILNPMYGKISPHRGKSIQFNTGKTHFKKGCISWNKDNNKYNITKQLLFQEYIVNKKTLTDISEQIGCSTSWIYKLLKKHKIKIRVIGIAHKGINKGKYNENSIIKHHLYLKENSDKTIKLSRKQHRQLHARAYDYIYYRYGKKEIVKYIKWFKKNFINKGV